MLAEMEADRWLLPMNESHLMLILEIERRAYAFPWTESIFRDCLRAGYSGWVLGTDSTGIVGYAMMSMAVGEAHVLNLSVDPQLHRRGYGRLLLNHLLHMARAAECTIALLEVRRSNMAALRLYENSAFQRIGLRKNYYPAVGGGEDAVVLERQLI